MMFYEGGLSVNQYWKDHGFTKTRSVSTFHDLRGKNITGASVAQSLYQ